jgi:hypothetical protein
VRTIAVFVWAQLALLARSGVAAADDVAPSLRLDVGRPLSVVDAAPDGPPGIFQPGTQPLQLSIPLRTPGLCDNCHGQYADYAANDTWKGTMMANAARDPLFHAALTVANQDSPNSGDICIRCHSPRAWLFGRSEPALIERLEAEDFESVECDFCHRLYTGPSDDPYIGNARYFVADDYVRRGPLRHPSAPHKWQYSTYFEDSRLCGLCHDVTNPLRGNFPIERTYSEWLASSYAREGKTCQSCHMPAELGVACGAPSMPEHTVHRHEFAGGNHWMPRVLMGEHPELGREAAYRATVKNAETKLMEAATVSVDAPARATAGEKLAFVIRVENMTGHKLPTGYPEGRRMWLEVSVEDGRGAKLFHSGAYDRASATRSADAQLRTYEVRMAAGGKEGFHFILQDQVLEDTRLLPRGFVPSRETMPVGRIYPVVTPMDAGADGSAILAHWDEAPYDLVLPNAAAGSVVIRATLFYQTTSREYVEFLERENKTDDYGRKMLDLWRRYDRAPPFGMASATATVEIDAPSGREPSYEPSSEPVPEAGPNSESEAGESPAGCACALRTSRPPSRGWLFAASVGLAFALSRSQRAARTRRSS